MDKDTMRRLDATCRQGGIASVNLEMYCTGCGKVLMQIAKGSTTFGPSTTHDGTKVCDCSWACCDVALPSNRRHAHHREYRKAVSNG